MFAGMPLEGSTLNWGISRIKSFFEEVERREKQQPQTLPDGGDSEGAHSGTEAERELDIAIKLFRELTLESKKEDLEKVILHIFRAIELWIDDQLARYAVEKSIHRKEYSERELRTVSFDKKIEILRKERIIKDPVLLMELSQITNLRNRMIHAREPWPQLSTNEIYRYLQIAMHFVKIKSPSIYEGRRAEEQVRKIIERHNIDYRTGVLMRGHSVNSRFDFVIEKSKLIIEARHSRAPSGLSIFTESMAFRIVDLKKKDRSWKFIVVLSGQWSERSRNILEGYADYVVRLEDFEDLLERVLAKCAS